MPLAEDLLKQAFLLARKEPKHPSQASLRRAISTAYYALFHLLVEEASANWGRADTRDFLARAFQHSTMKNAATRAANADYPGVAPDVVLKLRFVAQAFRELQVARHLADYSYVKHWSRAQTLEHVEQVDWAFANWRSIRNEYIAQRFLVSLLSDYKEG